MSGPRLAFPSSLTLLICAAALGISLGIIQASHSTGSTGLHSDAINTYAVQINGTSIRQLDYHRALNLLASGKRAELSSADRELVLERLIQEELLLQYALDADLLRNDRKLRGAVLRSVIAGLDIQSRAAPSASPADGGLEIYLKQLRSSAAIHREPLQ